MATALSRHVGGKGANQAVAAAQAGSATRLSARVGRDDGATWVLEFLRSAGVDIEVVTRDPDAPTGQAFITVADGGENAIVVVAGANQRLAADDARFAPTADERVLLAQFETSFDPLLAQFAASDTGRLRVLNAAPAHR